MSNSKVIVSLTGVMDERFSIVEDDHSPFGYYIKFNNKLYEPDFCLHEVISDNVISGEAADIDDSGFCSDGFCNVQGSIIEV